MVKKPLPKAKAQDPKTAPLWLLLPLAALLLLAFFPANRTGSSSMTQEEQRIAAALSQLEGAGKVHVVIHTPESSTFTAASSPAGVLILCQGAHDLAVQFRISLATQTLLGVSADQIRIFPMEASP